ncbi:MAG: 30S ribosome-binding factor RbfA [Bacteroidetes bacterium]|nr:30S ribosome-binding factor RbfA [Bacteroidota bacterium]MBP7398031.1 30S ribosome-binding factor RbfA [Chitinophagales bacterium]MBK7108531.1 30S ribosome-binding factor RbfA [Bacteroidota bacterium]MBK8489146.1 30S ribosome-binding factor RbfA [Bacteroidota bacterium]MBK8680995.1 30S ribosome-binding factor RbfA [Bacteroidota bacterium]
METRRQQKMQVLIKEEMSKFLQREGSNYYGTQFVTVTDVRITPDMHLCRIYVSVFNVATPQQTVDRLNAHIKDIRKRFGNIMRGDLRIIPELEFILDDTLDNVFKLEQLLNDLK